MACVYDLRNQASKTNFHKFNTSKIMFIATQFELHEIFDELKFLSPKSQVYGKFSRLNFQKYRSF